MAEGCSIEKSTITHSVIGLRSKIRANVIIKDSILMGNDYYEWPSSREALNAPLEIGADCVIEGAIIDKNCRIGKGTVIKGFPRGTDIDGRGWVVRDGIVVIPKSTTLPPGTRIGPEES